MGGYSWMNFQPCDQCKKGYTDCGFEPYWSPTEIDEDTCSCDGFEQVE